MSRQAKTAEAVKLEIATLQAKLSAKRRQLRHIEAMEQKRKDDELLAIARRFEAKLRLVAEREDEQKSPQ